MQPTLYIYVLTTTNKYEEEKALLAALARGDQAAFTAIYERYHPLIYRYALDFLKLPQLAEDLVHEVFMKIWVRREQLMIQSSLSAYLHRAARNYAFNMLTKIAADRNLRAAIVHQLEASMEGDLSEAARMEHYEKLLHQSLESMPRQRRRVFELCRQQGKSYDEAAAELGISKNTVKEHLVKALHFLRKDLLSRRDLIVLIALLEKLF